jgi:hypothetical protein
VVDIPNTSAALRAPGMVAASALRRKLTVRTST